MVTALVKEDEILAHLDRITSSSAFSSSPRLIQFLRFCVEASVKGEAEKIKESTIGVSVFGRPPDYDPQIDPIVRVHARRLRDKLKSFYQTEGREEEIVVEIRKGGYIPRFERRAGPLSDPASLLPITAPPPVLFPADVSAVESSLTVEHRSFWLSSKAWLVALTALMCVIAGWGAARIVRHRMDRETGKSSDTFLSNANGAEILPLTPLPGAERDAAWSPDGKSIAFSWIAGANERSRIYIMSVPGGSPVSLTDGSHQEFRPAWSADGQSIAFIRKMEGFTYQIVLLDQRTRTERVIHTLQFDSVLPDDAPALDWSRDGQWIVTSEQKPEAPAHLLLISVAGGSATQITDPPNASTGDVEARFSPSGSQVAFRRGGVGDLWILNLSGSQVSGAHALTLDNPGVHGICWSADGESIFFGSRKKANVFSIWSIPSGGGAATQITPSAVEAVSPSLSPDGKRLAFVHPAIVVNIWRYDLASPGRPRVFSPSTRQEFGPAFSQDGRQVAFISDRSGPTEVWVSDTDGSQARKITSLNGAGLPFMPSWSPDGNRIAFFFRRDGENFAMEVPASGGLERVIEGGPSYTLSPQYSADGKSIYYISNSGGRFRIWQKSTDGASAPAEVTTEETRSFRLSPDGHWLYFLREGAPSQLIRMNLATNQEQTVWTWNNPRAFLGGWDIGGDHLYYVGQLRGETDAKLIHADLTTKKESVLGTLRTSSWQSGIAVTRNGDSVLVSQVDRDDTNVMYINLGQSKSPSQ